MHFKIFITLALTLLLVSCGKEGEPSYIKPPAVKIIVNEVGHDYANIRISSINAEKLYYVCDVPSETENLTAEEVVNSGKEASKNDFTIEGLKERTEYYILAAATGANGRISSLDRDTLHTTAAPSEPNEPDNSDDPDNPVDNPDTLYFWERSRTEIPTFADMALCYGGHSARNPQVWTPERFEKTAVYTDENGRKHWFFDAMLMLEIWDDNYKVTYSIANDGKDSSRKSHWERLLDYWFDDVNGFQALDDCIAEAAAEIGTPETPRYIVMSVPDPVYFENYTEGASGKDRNTVYWGEIDGVEMDFSLLSHRLEAYKWFIDETRARFAQKEYKYIELLGFYVLSESLAMKGSWRYEYKQHEELIPQVADYCHSVNEGLYWIPYSVSSSDAGHNKALKNWKQFGFDLAILQPNYYWDDKAWSTTCYYINTYGMGMELEFEGTHGEPGGTSILSKLSNGQDNPNASVKKARFRQYMSNAKENGIYGEKPLVLYTGTNALYELAVSEDAEDKALYHEFGRFIIDSPLK